MSISGWTDKKMLYIHMRLYIGLKKEWNYAICEINFKYIMLNEICHVQKDKYLKMLKQRVQCFSGTGEKKDTGKCW